MSLFNTLIPSFQRSSATESSAPATVRPHHQVNENDQAYNVTVQLPGVAKDGLEITAEAGEIRIVGRRAWQQPEGWTSLYRESTHAPFELVLTHDNAVDAEKISAELRDGVLQVTLPKAEAVKPRKIAVS